MHSTPLLTDRSQLIARLQESPEFDLLVIGGGATGLSVALDAACRGHRVALLEAHDFAEGSSSRATKLLHGGVRYLAQGNLALVREALRERTAMLRNAPHLASPLAFVMPSYHFGEQSFHHLGLWLYDALAGAASLGKAQGLSRLQALQALPTLRTDGLKGGVRFWDGQFDDARLALDERFQPGDAVLERRHESAEITPRDPCRSPVNGYELLVKEEATRVSTEFHAASQPRLNRR
jgi:glycerol-3-phosphate dehydrogenase